MASSGNSRGKLLRAGGILSIVAGTYMTAIVVWVALIMMLPSAIAILPSGVVRVCNLFVVINVFFPSSLFFSSYQWGVFGGCYGILGIVAIVGGISAIRRWRFGLSLAGAICALPTVILGILAVIFVALGKKNLVQRGKEMASNGNSRGGLLTIGGVLSIIGGALEVIGGGIMLGLVIAHRELFRLGSTTGHPVIRSGLFGEVDLIWAIIIGVPLIVLGIIAIVGGVSAIRRKSFGLSLAGAICALPAVYFSLFLAWVFSALPTFIMVILAVTFVALGKREFGRGLDTEVAE
jgi:hypothetical protein